MLTSSFLFASLWISSTTQFITRSRILEIKSNTHAMLQLYGTHASSTVLLFFVVKQVNLDLALISRQLRHPTNCRLAQPLI